MNFEKKDLYAKGIRISITENGFEVGRTYIYLIQNDLHAQPFGLMEDVYVDESCRGKGIRFKISRKSN